MRILYIFPHPDDESFGVAHAMSRQRRDGHEVYLLTLTRGGATRVRHKLNLSVEEMGEVRLREMEDVARVLDLTGMTVLDLPDSGLKEMDPRDIERVVAEHTRQVRPDVLVSYAVHGISGFHDHLVSHAAVKRAYVELRREGGAPRRLAHLTLTQQAAEQASGHFKLSGSSEAEIDCLYPVLPEDIERAQRALDCYKTFQDTINQSGVREHIKSPVAFEFFQESFDPPLDDLFGRLPG